MAELTQDQNLQLRTLLESGALTPEQTVRTERLLATSTIEIEPPEPGTFPPEFRQDPFGVPGFARTVDEFTQSPEGQRLMLEAGGGIALSLVPPAAVAARLLPRAGPAIVRAFQGGAGEAAGSLAAETIDPSESPVRSAALSFGVGTAGGALGEAAIPLVKKAFAPTVGKLEPAARTLIRTVTGKGGIVTPGTALDSRSIDLLENIAEASLFGGGVLKVAKQKTRRLMQESVEEFAETFASKSSKEDIGVVLQHLIEEGADAFRASAKVLYRNVDRLTQDVSVPTGAIKRVMQSVQERSERGLGSATIRKMARRVAELRDIESFSVLQELRSDFLAITRVGTDIVGNKAQGAGKLLAGRIDKTMTFSAAKLDPEALKAFREANLFWKQGKETFNSSFIKGLARKDADVVFESAIKPARPLLIRKLRETIADPEVWKDVQGQFFADTLSKAADVDGIVSGELLLKELKKFGMPALMELLPQGQSATFRELAQALKLSQQPASIEGTGKMLIQLTQGGAFIDLGSFAAGSLLGFDIAVAPGTSTAILLAPAAMARVFTDKTLSRWLSIGLKAPPGSSKAIRAAAQFVAAMQKKGVLEQIEKE